MSDSSPSPQSLHAALMSKMQSLQLATVDDDGLPYASYTPFYFQNNESGAGRFFIFVSQLALHTRNLLSRPRAAVLIVDDEHNSQQIFARTRVSYQCSVAEILPDEQAERYESVLEEYQRRHGKTVELLRELPDFRLLELTPLKGMFVMGFGQAYRLDGEDLRTFTHVRAA